MKPFHVSFSFTLAFALITHSHRASAELVSFEGLASMPNASGTVVPVAARLSTQVASASGAIFSSASGTSHVAVVNLGQNHATSGTNGIGGVNAGGALHYGTAILVDFVLPSNPEIPAVVDFAAIRCDRFPIAGTVTMDAYDGSGVLIGSTTRNDGSGATFGVTNAGIRTVRIRGSSGTVAFDDLTFSTPVAINTFRLSIRREGSQANVCWLSLTDGSYQLQFASQLAPANWADLGAPVPGDGETHCIPIALDQTNRFYRVALLP